MKLLRLAYANGTSINDLKLSAEMPTLSPVGDRVAFVSTPAGIRNSIWPTPLAAVSRN